jgi:hypothetical protein
MANRTDGREGIRPWEREVDRFVADLPWGVFAFLLIALGGLIWTLGWPDSLSPGDYLKAVGGGSGLLAIGHGIRSYGKGH